MHVEESCMEYQGGGEHDMSWAERESCSCVGEGLVRRVE